MPLDADPVLPAGLRRVADEDADALIRIVGAAFDEYPGCVLDLPDLDADLVAPGTVAARRGSPWWVVERDGAVIATIGAGALTPGGSVELKRLYLARAARGRGLATALIRVVGAHAAGLGATQVELWTDTRFEPAHRRYAAVGFAPTEELRELHDPSHTTERRYVAPVTPRPPQATVTARSASGTETATLTPLPDGSVLRTVVPEQDLTAVVEVDGGWATRRAAVTTGRTTRVLTSDGDGRWWLDGEPAPQLHGALGVAVGTSLLDHTLAIGRLRARGVDDAEVTVAGVPVPAGALTRATRRYTRRGERTWRYAVAEGEHELTVDAHGLVAPSGDVRTRH